MVEVKLDFDSVNIAPVGIVKVELDGKEIRFVSDSTKVIEKENSKLQISNAVATNLVPCGDRVSIHIISEYKNLDNGEKLTVHERSYGEISSVGNIVNHTDMTSYKILLEDIDLFDYTVEVKTKEEILEDRFKDMQLQIDTQKKEIEMLKQLLIRANGRFNDFRDNIVESCK